MTELICVQRNETDKKIVESSPDTIAF